MSFAAAMLVAGTARADEAADTATARALGVEGVMLADAGRCDEAIERLERAERLHHAPTTATRLAECEIAVGKIVAGTERLQRVIREPLPSNAHPAFHAAVVRAQKTLELALPRVATLRISVVAPKGTKLTMAIDGEPASDAILETDRRIDPGTHTIEVGAPGFLTRAVTTSVDEGETKPVVVELSRAPDAPPSPGAPSTDGAHEPVTETRGSSLPAVVAFGLGALGLGLGIYGATIVESKSSILSSRCDANRVCPPEVARDLETAKTWATVSTGGFIAAGAGVATGILLLVLSGPSEPPRQRSGLRVRPVVGTAVGLSGAF